MKTPTHAENTAVHIHPSPEESPSLLTRFWRTLTHPMLLGVLTALTVSVLAADLWLPQLPTALTSDPVAATAWLNDAAARIPGGTLLQSLGAFDLAHNLALRVLLPLQAAVLLLHLVGGVLRAWDARRLHPPNRWLPGLKTWEAMLSPAPNAVSLRVPCASLCSSPRSDAASEDDGEMEWCDCHYRMQWLALAWELGLLLALMALLMNLYSGWQVAPIVLDPGQSASLAPYADKDVSLSEDATHIAICCPPASALVTQGSVGTEGVRAHVVSSGQAVQVILTRRGRPLQLQAIEENAHVARQLVVHFPKVRSERVIAAPEVNLAFRLVALDEGGVRVQALDAQNQTLFSQDVHGASDLPVGDDLMLRVHPTSYVTLRVQGRPWTWLLWPAGLLLLLGIFVSWRWPFWRAGMRKNEAGVSLRWQGVASTRRRFHHLLHLLSAEGETQIRSHTDTSTH